MLLAHVVCFPVRLFFLEWHLVPPPPPSPPGKLVREERSFCLREKGKGEGNKHIAFRRNSAYRMSKCCIKCQIKHANSKEKHAKGNRCENTKSLLMHGVCARLCTKGYMQQRQGLYKRWLPERITATAP